MWYFRKLKLNYCLFKNYHTFLLFCKVVVVKRFCWTRKKFWSLWYNSCLLAKGKPYFKDPWYITSRCSVRALKEDTLSLKSKLDESVFNTIFAYQISRVLWRIFFAICTQTAQDSFKLFTVIWLPCSHFLKASIIKVPLLYIS